MKKENKKFTEEKIKEYFNIEEKIKFTKNLIMSLEDKKMILEDKNKNLKLDFDINIKSSVIDSMPKGSSDGSSYFERNIIKQIEYNEKMIEKIEENIKSQENEIFRLEIKNTKMKNIINILSEDFKRMLEYRYIKSMSEIEIALKFNISISQYHRNKQKIMRSIYNMLVMYKEI